MKKRDLNLITENRHWLLFLICLPFSLVATAADADAENTPAGVDISKWECEYCVFEQGYSGEVEIGLGQVSDSSFKFGEYNGLYQDGAFVIGNASLRYRGEDAAYLDLQARDLGLDSRSLDVGAGRQGRYKLQLNYNEISHAISDSARTPYLGTGSDNLVLPAGWTRADSTAGMVDLNSSLHNVNLQTRRKRLGIGVDYIPASQWETAVNVHHEVRDGLKRSAGSFYFSSAQLIEPIDYVTDEVDASVSYNTDQWQSRLTYYASFFSNNDTSLSWQNPYNPIVPGADSGQRALPPDNQFHQILLTTGYQLSDVTRLNADLAIGRMEQDESLLDATTNPNFSVVLPRNSASAKVKTLTANLKFNTALNEKSNLRASWHYNDRDNVTPISVFDWVSTDAFAAAPRQNQPYSITDSILKLNADYRLSRKIRFSAGIENATKDRTHQEVDQTTENTLWGKISLRSFKTVDLTFKAAHAERNASGYHPVAETSPAQNPLLRKYNMADRSRDTGSVQASFSPGETLSIGLGAAYSKDRYSDSALGLTGSRETDYNADASLLLSELSSLHVFVSRQQISSDQAGSQSFSSPDWFSSNDDTIDSLGMGLKHQMLEGRLGLGADYMVSRSTGAVSVTPVAPGVAFPVLETRLDSLRLFADYRLRSDLSLHVAWWYERYDSRDWMLDGVSPDTIAKVLSLGESSPSYNLQAVMLSARYHF